METIKNITSIIIILTVCVGCSSGISSTGILHNGKPARMTDNLITVISTNIKSIEVYHASRWINAQLGMELITTTGWSGSRIWVKEAQGQQLVSIRHVAPHNGRAERCEVTINSQIRDRWTRIESLSHGILGCLGLARDDMARSIMNTGAIGSPFTRIEKDDITHLRSVYR